MKAISASILFCGAVGLFACQEFVPKFYDPFVVIAACLIALASLIAWVFSMLGD